MKITLPPTIHKEPTLAEYLGRFKKPFMAKIAFACAVKIYQRTLLSEAQNHRCCWCSKKMTEVPGSKDSATLEHVTPRSQGGADHPDNYAVACASCNHNRGTKTVEQYMAARLNQAVEEPEETLKKQNEQAQRTALVNELRKYGMTISSKKATVGRLVDKAAALDALSKNKGNIFEPDSRTYRYYQRYEASGFVNKACA